MEIAFEIVVDALKDTLLIVPFLLVIYIVMEWLEHKASDKTVSMVKRAGRFGPAVGAVLGVVPQCGFSAAASTLYAGRVLTIGTLVAVFLSTSDEMLPILIAEKVPIQTVFAILGTKLAIGFIVGFAVDIFARLLGKHNKKFAIDKLCELAGCHCAERCEGCEITCVKCHSVDESVQLNSFEAHNGKPNKEICACGQDAEDGFDDLYGHHHNHKHHHHGSGSIIKSAIKHTVQITLFIFIATLVLNVLFVVIGEENISVLINSNSVLSVFASTLLGVIPNCASSVLITQMYINNMLSASAMISGLLMSAGVGYLVLFRTNRKTSENILILVGLYCVSVACGMIVLCSGIVF